jgi:membrane-bound ClpP family serine protease
MRLRGKEAVMNNHEALVQQFVAAVIQLAGSGRTGHVPALAVPSFGDVEAAVRQHFKITDANPEALLAAVRKASATGRPDAFERALSDLEASHAQELVARQQTAFLIGMEVGRAAAGR